MNATLSMISWPVRLEKTSCVDVCCSASTQIPTLYQKRHIRDLERASSLVQGLLSKFWGLEIANQLELQKSSGLSVGAASLTGQRSTL